MIRVLRCEQAESVHSADMRHIFKILLCSIQTIKPQHRISQPLLTAFLAHICQHLQFGSRCPPYCLTENIRSPLHQMFFLMDQGSLKRAEGTIRQPPRDRYPSPSLNLCSFVDLIVSVEWQHKNVNSSALRHAFSGNSCSGTRI